MKKINILVPDLPESISDATIVKWHKKINDIVKCDDNIVDIETDKVMLEVSSPCDGILKTILEQEGKIVKSQQIIGTITQLNNISHETAINQSDSLIEKHASITQQNNLTKNTVEYSLDKTIKYFSPSIRRLMQIHKKNNNVFSKTTQIQKNINLSSKNILDTNNYEKKDNHKLETRVPMSRLRQKIAERLLHSQKNTAMLTTFNEVNMAPIILLRKKYGEIFEKQHGIKLGFMSFFVKATIQALKKFPQINASIDKNDIVFYKNFDISIAISTPRGLITPVLRNPENMSMSEIEKKIKEFSIKGIQNKIHIEELIGGNFTITNGGVFGSLISTPIINPPQTAILGINVIKDRPVAVDNKVQILPMMYLALSYDHRLIDGKESVGFLLTIKNILEDFTLILIDV